MLCSISLILIAGMFMGLTVLEAAVLAIVLTVPLGAFAIDLMYGRLLKKRWCNKSGFVIHLLSFSLQGSESVQGERLTFPPWDRLCSRLDDRLWAGRTIKQPNKNVTNAGDGWGFRKIILWATEMRLKSTIEWTLREHSIVKNSRSLCWENSLSWGSSEFSAQWKSVGSPTHPRHSLRYGRQLGYHNFQGLFIYSKWKMLFIFFQI